jgi:hypothetical protein
MAVLAAACGQDSTVSPSSSVVAAPQFFTGTIPVGGSRFYSVTLTRAGTVELTLISVSLDARVSTLGTAMGLGSGVPNGPDCELTRSVNTVPGLTAQLKTAMGAGTFCVKVFDIGSLTTPVNVAVRIIRP